MNHAMKNAIRIAGVVAGLAAAAWAVRDRMLPAPEAPTDTPPRFRSGSTPTMDDLTEIKGVGPAFASRLSEADIVSFADLAKQEADELSEAVNTTPETAQRWIDDADARS
jgi:predicted flap endonuclease-1-like 5' DNA nuclease